jgi:hypothetical protein
MGRSINGGLGAMMFPPFRYLLPKQGRLKRAETKPPTGKNVTKPTFDPLLQRRIVALFYRKTPPEL